MSERSMCERSGEIFEDDERPAMSERDELRKAVSVQTSILHDLIELTLMGGWPQKAASIVGQRIHDLEKSLAALESLLSAPEAAPPAAEPVCTTCGHGRSTHGEEMPYACMDPDMCDCEGFSYSKPAEPPAGEDWATKQARQLEQKAWSRQNVLWFGAWKSVDDQAQALYESLEEREANIRTAAEREMKDAWLKGYLDGQKSAFETADAEAKDMAERERKARLDENEQTPHYSGCATLLATRDPYPECNCWVGERRRALSTSAPTAADTFEKECSKTRFSSSTSAGEEGK